MWYSVNLQNVRRNIKDKDDYFSLLPSPAAVRSKAWVCGRLLAGIAGLNPGGDMGVGLLWVLCFGLVTRLEESYGIWCVWTWSWSLESEESLAHYGLSCHNTNSFFFYLSQCFSMCKFKQLCLGNAELHMVIWFFFTTINIFFSLGATTPIGGCILQPSSGL